MRVRFWGVRGGLPVPGAHTATVGGNTACVELRSAEGDLIILDAGSGLRPLGQELTSDTPRRVVATILIGNRHVDHMQGLPFFAPMRLRGNRFVIIAPSGMSGILEPLVAGEGADVYYPPQPGTDLRADVLVKELKEGEPTVVGRSVVVRSRRVEDPLGGMGFRVSADGHTVAYVCDLRHPAGELDRQVVELARGADLLIHDAQLTPEERLAYPDWVHSSWEEAARAAREAGARRLALFHHAPDADEDTLHRVERLAQAICPGAFLACEGSELDLAVPIAASAEDQEQKVALRRAARRIVSKLKDNPSG
jgi:phosphoribosyl 1,2-cyclic phosphodiesterase